MTDYARLLTEADGLRVAVARYRASILQAAACASEPVVSDKARRKAAKARTDLAQDKARFIKAVYEHLGDGDLLVAFAAACEAAGIKEED